MLTFDTPACDGGAAVSHFEWTAKLAEDRPTSDTVDWHYVEESCADVHQLASARNRSTSGQDSQRPAIAEHAVTVRGLRPGIVCRSYKTK